MVGDGAPSGRAGQGGGSAFSPSPREWREPPSAARVLPRVRGRDLPSPVAAQPRAGGRGPRGCAAPRRARWSAGPGLGPWAGPLSASPAAAWPPRLAVGAGCAGWPRRWCWRAPGCRFTAFGSSDRGCVALSDLTRFRGGGSLFWFKELCKHGFKEQIKSAGSCTACGRKFMIVFCVL